MRGSDGGAGGVASFLLCERIRKKMKIKIEGRQRRTNTSIVVETTSTSVLDFNESRLVKNITIIIICWLHVSYCL